MKNKNFFKSKFFLNLFLIPSIIWFLISLIAMIPDEQESDPVTWTELITVNIILILIWFIISCIISLIYFIIKNKNNKKQEKTKKRNPNLVKNNKDKIIVKNNSSQNGKGIFIDLIINFFAMVILIWILYFGYDVIYHSRFAATMIIVLSAPFFWGNFILYCSGKNTFGQMLVKHTNNKKQISKKTLKK